MTIKHSPNSQIGHFCGLQLLLLMNYVSNPTVIILCINIGLLYYRTQHYCSVGPVIQQPNVNA